MRVKTGTTRHKRHKKVLKRTKGMRMSKGKLYKVSKEADLHKSQYEYIGRKLRKRDLRRLWITRINAGLTEYGDNLKYSTFIKLLKDKKIDLNRKILAELVVSDPHVFQAIVKKVSK